MIWMTRLNFNKFLEEDTEEKTRGHNKKLKVHVCKESQTHVNRARHKEQ